MPSIAPLTLSGETDLSPTETLDRFAGEFNGTKMKAGGWKLFMDRGDGSLIYRYRYTPAWAQTLAVIGALFFLLGLFFLLVKKEESLTVTAQPTSSDATRWAIMGTAPPWVISRVGRVATSLPVTGAARPSPGDEQIANAPTSS